MTVMAAQSAIARVIDDLLANGDSVFEIEGLLNLTGVLESTAGTKTGGGTSWLSAGATPDEILKDMNLMISDVRAALKQADAQVPQFAKFTMLLPSLNYQKVATTARSTTSDTTILQFFLKNNPWIESVEEWNKCDTGDPGTSGPRAVIFPRTPLWGGAIIPQEFTQLTPQEDGLRINVPCTATCGGVITRYPVAARYMDLIG